MRLLCGYRRDFNESGSDNMSARCNAAKLGACVSSPFEFVAAVQLDVSHSSSLITEYLLLG